MESSPSSKLSFFTPSGKFIESPIEGLDCGIAVDIPKEKESIASLKLGATTLPLWFGEGSLCALSAWPACGPGQYKVSLECGDIRERRIITVTPRNFTEIEFNYLLYELTEVLPLSIATRLQKCGGLAGVTIMTAHALSIEQELYRLNKMIRGTKDRLGILQLLQMIQQNCHQVLIPQHELRRANRARRPDIAKLPQAMSMPGNVGPSGYLNQMFDMTVKRSYETYENRLVKAYVQALQSQLSRLLARVEAEQSPPEIARHLQELFGEFRLTCARTAFLKQVRLPFNSAGRITMVLLKNTAYRTVLEDYLSLFKQAAIRVEEPALNSSLSKFPFLYQRWSNLKVVNAVLQVCAENGYQCRNHRWVTRDEKGIVLEVMKEGMIAIELSSPTTGKIIRIVPWSPSNLPEPSKYRPEMPPAISICIYAAGKAPLTLVFDPRYEVAEVNPEKAVLFKPDAKVKTLEELGAIAPMPEQIQELHHSLEAMTIQGGIGEIQYAAILYPGLSKQIAPGFDAFTARPEQGEGVGNLVANVIRHYLA